MGWLGVLNLLLIVWQAGGRYHVMGMGMESRRRLRSVITDQSSHSIVRSSQDKKKRGFVRRTAKDYREPNPWKIEGGRMED